MYTVVLPVIEYNSSDISLIQGVLSSVAESAGISLFTLDVLPHSPSYIGLLLMNGVFLFPIICQLYFSARRHKRGLVSESRRATIVLGIALAFCLSGIVLTAYFEIGESFKNITLRLVTYVTNLGFRINQ